MNYIHNIIYHIYTGAMNPIFYYNIENLKKYLPKFNGKKIININYKNKEEAERFIEKSLSDLKNVKIYLTDNNETNGLYELYPFLTKTLPEVFSLEENEFTFYGHTNGVTRYNTERELVSLLWSHVMYTRNLDNFEYINSILKNYCCAGCLKINKPFSALSFVNWHYSGAFFWFRNKDLFSKEWKRHYNTVYGLEGYLATHFKNEEAFSIQPELPDGYEDIYKKINWEYFYKV